MGSTFDSAAKQYGRTRRSLPAKALKYVASILKWHVRHSGDVPIKYIDVATGNGLLIRNLEPLDGIEFIGTDISGEMIAEARQLPANNAIEFLMGDVHRLGFPEESFRVITCCQAIHLFEIQRFFLEIGRVLHRDGVLIAITFDLLASQGSPAEYTNNVFQSMLSHELWPGFSKSGIHPTLLEQAEAYELVPVETRSIDCVSSFDAQKWQARVAGSSLTLKINPTSVRDAILEAHERGLEGLFGGGEIEQRQRCWIVTCCRPGSAIGAFLRERELGG